MFHMPRTTNKNINPYLMIYQTLILFCLIITVSKAIPLFNLIEAVSLIYKVIWAFC